MTQHPRFPGSLMTALGENYEWYIGRDGQQFGPVNSTEMGKLIELGHLKPGDLVWRAGFAEWQSANAVFTLAELGSAGADAAENAGQSSAPVEPPAAPEPTRRPSSYGPETAQSQARTADPAAGDYVHPRQATVSRQQASFQQEGRRSADDVAAAPTPEAPLRLEDVAAAIKATHGHDEARHQQTPVQPQFERRMPAGGGEAAQGRAIHDRDVPAPEVTSSEVVPAHHRKKQRKQPSHDHSRRRRRSRAALLISIGALAVVGSAAGAAYIWREDVTRIVGQLTGATSQPEPDVAQEPAPVMPPAQPQTLAAADAIDQSPVWTFLKTEFPEWHAERMREAARLRAEKKDEATVTRYLAEQLVQLRRNYADDALGAPLELLSKIADTFVTNLLQLNRESADICYSFISHGEASGAVLPLFARKDLSDPLEAQMLAMFQAVAEGRKQRIQHLPPGKSDYDQLARMLVRRGWTEQDLQVFSDPRALGRAPPAVVCRLVREWFQSQLALEDQSAQVRLLAESLRPVVGG